jgi:hypothetical protein
LVDPDVETMKLSQHSFDVRGHESFCTSSGDYNPIHCDATFARRTQAGAPIVHGIHSLLRLLEDIARYDIGLSNPTTLRVTFGRPVYVGEEAMTETMEVTAEVVRARMQVERTDAVVATLRSSSRCLDTANLGGETKLFDMPSRPCELPWAEMCAQRGSVRFPTSAAAVRDLFPAAARCFGSEQIAALLCCSGLVGMVVPGLHSLLTGLEISFSTAGGTDPDALKFAVVSTESRFGIVRIAIRGGGLCGMLETVRRPPPVQQPSMATIQTHVAPGEFRETTALVVGGSRGLGEVVAKLIAAGGGRVTLTYVAGRLEAESLCREINASGEQCRAGLYDVRRPAVAQLDALGGEPPAQIYYFATPPISRRQAMLFDPRRFEEFSRFYLTGFLDLVQLCLLRRPQGIDAFFPSTEYVDTRPPELTEYAMSKAAAEVLCEDMEASLSHLRVVKHRLPRILTDQTASVGQKPTLDPIAVLLPIVRQMHLR